jgi:hypothetical protein
MSRPGMLSLIVVVLMALGAARAQAFGPGEAAGGPPARQAVKALPGRADFVVLVWYRRDNPLATFQSQTYDARKGQYTAAVDDWVQAIRTKYPAYLVVVRAVDLSRVAGETEQLKVGSVIHRELLIAAAASGVVLGEPLRISPGPPAGPNQAARVNPLPAVGGDRSFLNPTPTAPAFNPYVYPRVY